MPKALRLHSRPMLARVHSFTLAGIDPLLCEIECDVSNHGTSHSEVVGLAQAAVKESMDRVRRSIINSGFSFAAHRVLVNLAPADVRKEGPSLDLPIAIGLLRGTHGINGSKHDDYLIAGELALDGRVRKIKGALSLAMLARDKKFRGVIVPAENAREAAVVEGVEVIAVETLLEAASFLNDLKEIPPHELDGKPFAQSQINSPLDFADVRGQEAVKRALTIAAAGAHNVLMIGPPGTGKTMLALRLAGILPPLTRSESLETTRIYSAMGLLPDGVALMDQRPVRTPHHSATAQALVGGGSIPKPGEVSLAHNGILFLDELPEFQRTVLEMLRQPLEGREVTVTRVHGSVKFPAGFMLVAAMNPTQGGKESQDPRDKQKYLSRLSGPLLDRIDLHVEVPAVPYRELTGKSRGTDSAAMRASVSAARAIQLKRFGDSMTNARMGSKQLQTHVELDDACLLLMKQAMDELGLSARAYDKVRRVARTIADLESAPTVQEHHLAEAVQYRLLDRKF